MREILFRGKRVDNGRWAEGYYRHHKSKVTSEEISQILADDGFGFHWVQIIPDSMGQYTGLTGKNGKRIFEGDIIKIPDDYDEFGHNAGEIYEVYFCLGGFRLKPKYTKAKGYWLEDDRTVEVIGNIHDNPELLEGESGHDR